eukprot:7788014-Pyramimonas_sp.AAC.2
MALLRRTREGSVGCAASFARGGPVRPHPEPLGALPQRRQLEAIVSPKPVSSSRRRRHFTGAYEVTYFKLSCISHRFAFFTRVHTLATLTNPSRSPVWCAWTLTCICASFASWSTTCAVVRPTASWLARQAP